MKEETRSPYVCSIRMGDEAYPISTSRHDRRGSGHVWSRAGGDPEDRRRPRISAFVSAACLVDLQSRILPPASRVRDETG